MLESLIMLSMGVQDLADSSNVRWFVGEVWKWGKTHPFYIKLTILLLLVGFVLPRIIRAWRGR